MFPYIQDGSDSNNLKKFLNPAKKLENADLAKSV